MSHAKMQELYAKIPTFKCKEGCGDCCGPVPFSPSEATFAAMEHKAPLAELEGILARLAAGETDCDKCPQSTPQGCKIYDKRPFMCRIFGATDQHGVGMASLVCPHGCKPENPLTEAQVNELTDEYLSITGAEEIQELREHRARRQ